MKKISLIVIFLLISFYGFSQSSKSIDSFLGIKFGSNEETVKTAILAKGGKLSAERSTADILEFDDFSDGKRKIFMVAIKFYNDAAYEADVFYSVEPASKIISYYNSIVNELNKYYGNGKSEKTFTAPYKAGDGQELRALESGKAIYHTQWSTTVDRSTVEAQIFPTLSILVTYKHPPQ